MKYAHLADLHLGSWRDQKMRDLSTKAFLMAIDQCLQQRVDFILFAGDIFNTSLPSLDTLKIVTQKLKELHTLNIPLYVIAGSHDFSPSGKTMVDVLEKAGLLKNVCRGEVNPETKELHLKFTVDEKTQAHITGILGRKGMLDRTYYQNLHRHNLESEPGYKIFMFHTTINEMKPNHLAQLESQPASFLPKGFNYYAGGHIHHPTKIEIPEYGPLTYPGALFPNNFAELEKYSCGGYYIISQDGPQTISWQPLEVIKHKALTINCVNKNPESLKDEILQHFFNLNLTDTLITLRLEGKLQSGKVSDINFKLIFETLYHQNAYFVMKNTAKLNSEEFSEILLAQKNPATVEDELIREHLQQVKLFDKDLEFHLTKNLLSALNTTKIEGETITDFQNRINTETSKILNQK